VLSDMRIELTALLDQHPMSRSVMPALACLEQALRLPKGSGIERLPGPVLSNCCERLDHLLADSISDALWALRIHLQAVARKLYPALKISSSIPQLGVQVEEASFTAYMSIADGWQE
jgi:hypothetical protein